MLKYVLKNPSHEETFSKLEQLEFGDAIQIFGFGGRKGMANFSEEIKKQQNYYSAENEKRYSLKLYNWMASSCLITRKK